MLLFATDKLFVPLAVGGAFVAAVIYVIRRRELTVTSAGYFLLASVLAVLAANILLAAIDASGLTTIASGATTSPFNLIDSSNQGANALVYAVLALLTNLGANPVHDVVVARDIPKVLSMRLLQPATIPYLANAVVLVLGLLAILHSIWSPLRDLASKIVLLLAGASVTALGIFVVTDHYHPVDARYVAIVLMPIFLALAVYMRSKQFVPRYAVALALWPLVVSPLAIFSSWQHYAQALDVQQARLGLARAVAKDLADTGISTLVGDYWYVTPVRAAAKSPVTIVPTTACINQREVLTSTAWSTPERLARPAAYLAVRDPNGKTYGGCSISTITGHFGSPTNFTQLPGYPEVLLLVYGQGLQAAPITNTSEQIKTAEPTYAPLQSINKRHMCKQGVTLNVVAHQDDDLLFLNPDVQRDIDAGRCIRTVFVTAGDAGQDFAYWQGREQGAMAAYAKMYGVQNSWRQAYQTIGGQRVSVHYLNGAPNLSLVFMRLPDGGLDGEGFDAEDRQSLQRLHTGDIKNLGSVDGRARYTEQGFIAALVTILTTDKPDTIRTQDDSAANRGEDHSDHRLVGYYMKLAHSRYHRGHTLKTYLGYTQRFQPANLSPEDIARKQDAFFTYGQQDPSVCRSVEECEGNETYPFYLYRRYVVDDIVRGR